MNITGMSGNFTPFAKLYGKFFTDEEEPQSWDKNFANMYKNYFNGKDLPIKSLDYYYKKEKKSRKALRNLDNIFSFINDNPHIGNKQYFFDVTGTKPKIVILKNLKKKQDDDKKIEPAIKIEQKKKKSRKRRGRAKIKMIKIKRV